jgi:anti-sigma B factor antagonist
VRQRPYVWVTSVLMHYPAGTDEDGIAIDTGRVDGTGVVTVAGEVDVLSGTRLRRILGDMLDTPSIRAVVVDLTTVTLLSSTGLAVLVDTDRHADERGRRLVLVVDPATRAVPLALHATGIAALFTIQPDIEQALRSLG